MSATTAQHVIKDNSSIVSGQKSELSVLLADLRQCKKKNYCITTKVNHILNDSHPQTIITMLNDHYTCVVDSIIAEGGILDK